MITERGLLYRPLDIHIAACRSMSTFVFGKTSSMNFWVYILRCADESYYTGHTDNLEKRVAEHQVGEVPGYTFSRRPVTLVYSEVFTTREEALASERRIKG